MYFYFQNLLFLNQDIYHSFKTVVKNDQVLFYF